MRKFLIAAAAAAALSAPAAAADLPMTVPAAIPAPMVFDWSGFYVGAHIGYSWMDGDVSFAYAGPPAVAGASRISSSGVMGGLHIGFNLQSGAFVYGIEADVSYSGDPTGSFIMFPAAPGNFDNFRGFAGVDWSGSVRGRFGWAFDRTLIYVTGGVAIGSAEFFLAAHQAAGNFVGGASRRETLVGWTLGAGIEYAWTNNISMRLEYRYTDFGSIDAVIPAGGILLGATNGSADITTHDVRLGLTYRFAPPPAPVQARF